MTAEIAIMNRQGIALAADSAVTVGEKKVWQYANKLFSLSPHNDLGIMIYGAGSFIGFPWETVVKCFRKRIGVYKFQTVEECTDKFIEYLANEISDESEETLSVFRICLMQLFKIGGSYNKNPALDIDAEIERISTEIKKKEKTDFAVSHSEIVAIAENKIKEGFMALFKKEISNSTLKAFLDLCFEVCNRKVASGFETGVVIAGFGEKEYFPALRTYTVDGKFKGTVRTWLQSHTTEDLNQSKHSARIIPFAQKDMFYLFLEGIAQENLHWLHTSVMEVLNSESKVKEKDEAKAKEWNKKVVDELMEEFYKFRSDTFVAQVMDVVESLPKEEMADMAEALVELTSLRRKIDSSVQSVGGPIDVGIISKGDGFIWKERKHYFDIELNSDFMVRKKLQLEGGKV